MAGLANATGPFQGLWRWRVAEPPNWRRAMRTYGAGEIGFLSMNTSYKAEDSSTRRHHITRLVGRYMVIQSCAAALEEVAEAQPAEDISLCS